MVPNHVCSLSFVCSGYSLARLSYLSPPPPVGSLRLQLSTRPMRSERGVSEYEGGKGRGSEGEKGGLIVLYAFLFNAYILRVNIHRRIIYR